MPLNLPEEDLKTKIIALLNYTEQKFLKIAQVFFNFSVEKIVQKEIIQSFTLKDIVNEKKIFE